MDVDVEVDCQASCHGDGHIVGVRHSDYCAMDGNPAESVVGVRVVP